MTPHESGPWIAYPDMSDQERIAAAQAFYEDKPFLEDAPALIVVFGQRKGGVFQGERRKNYYMNESVGIATGFLLTGLHAARLATLTHTPNPMNFLNQQCERPVVEKPVMIIVVGHPLPHSTIPTHALIKKPLGEISSWL